MGLDQWAFRVKNKAVLNRFEYNQDYEHKQFFYWRKNRYVHNWMEKLYQSLGGKVARRDGRRGGKMKQDVSSNEIVDELEEAKRLLNEADSKLDEAAKIFCSVLHGKNVCYKECPAFTEGWTQCYIEDSFSNIDMISEKIDCLLKSCGEIRRSDDDERKR